MFEVSSFRAHTSSKSSMPLINGHVDSRLFKAASLQLAAASVRQWCGFLSGIHDTAWQPRLCSQLDWDMDCLEASSLDKWSPVFFDAALQQHRCSASCAMNVACRYQSSVPLCPSHAISSTNNPIPSVPVLVHKFLNKPFRTVTFWFPQRFFFNQNLVFFAKYH